MYDARTILKEIATPETRREILATFWKHGEEASKHLAIANLAKDLRFREVSLRKMPVERKAELLGSRAAVATYHEFLEMALMLWHTHHQQELMGSFLDEWKIPHENGTIDADEVTAPSEADVRRAAESLKDRFSREEIVLYLASAGLLMGDDWRAATWPVADSMME